MNNGEKRKGARGFRHEYDGRERVQLVQPCGNQDHVDDWPARRDEFRQLDLIFVSRQIDQQYRNIVRPLQNFEGACDGINRKSVQAEPAESGNRKGCDLRFILDHHCHGHFDGRCLHHGITSLPAPPFEFAHGSQKAEAPQRSCKEQRLGTMEFPRPFDNDTRSFCAILRERFARNRFRVEMMQRWEKELNWLPAGDPRNPFSFEVLDCRAACAALRRLTLSETASPAFAAIEDVVQASASTTLPADPINVPCTIHVGARAPSSGPADRMSSSAGHKWFLQFAGQTLVARRRWTGQTIHVGEFDLQGSGFTVTRLASEKTSVYNDPAYAAAELEFLLKVLLEERRAAFPAPPGLDRNNRTRIALHGWKEHGSLAEFARILPAG